MILTGKNLYKEAELLPDMKSVRLGTATECEIRLRRELFFGQIELTFVQNDGAWSVLCSDNLYLNVGDARKLFTLRQTAYCISKTTSRISIRICMQSFMKQN